MGKGGATSSPCTMPRSGHIGKQLDGGVGGGGGGGYVCWVCWVISSSSFRRTYLLQGDQLWW